MSPPATKALPAPVMIVTRIAVSAEDCPNAFSSSARVVMSSALSVSGRLTVIVAIPFSRSSRTRRLIQLHCSSVDGAPPCSVIALIGFAMGAFIEIIDHGDKIEHWKARRVLHGFGTGRQD